MIQKLAKILLLLIGLIIIILPYKSGDDAYFIKDTFYVNLVDSVDMGYEPFLKNLVQKDRNQLAFKEKTALREKAKPKGDKLDLAAMKATANKDAMLLERINADKNNLTMELMEKEAEIDQKYNVESLSAEEFKKLFDEVKAKNSKEDYLVALANELVNPTQNEKIKPITKEDISVQRINKQDAGPFVLSGFMLILIGGFLLLFDLEIIPLHLPKVKYSILAFFAFLCLVMAYKTYTGINNQIEFGNTLAEREKVVKEKLMDIRALQLTYFEKKNKYCNDFEDLITFAKKDSVQIVKYLVNKDDTAAVNAARKKGLPLEEMDYVSVMEKALNNKKINIEELGIVPFTKDTFEINAGVIDKNGRNVHVFEVKTSKLAFVKELTTLPKNFDKSKYLILGSMSEPTTEGNW